MKLPKHISLSISHNSHAGDYRTAAQWLDQAIERDEYDIAEEDRAEILRTGEVWTMSWCPDTPVGSVGIAAASLARLLELACPTLPEVKQAADRLEAARLRVEYWAAQNTFGKSFTEKVVIREGMEKAWDEYMALSKETERSK